MEIENHQCTQCSKNFKVYPEDGAFYAKLGVPLPQRCPQCRLQTRLAYRNERTLFANICANCNASILSMYNPADGYTVYCTPCWWSDSWDSTEYGQDIDWGRSLLEQWKEVRKKVPRLALVSTDSENSDYTNMGDHNKNSYLIFAAEQNENCSYGKFVQSSKDCFDCNFIFDSELCYESVSVRNCYRSIYLENCENSRDCAFSIGLKNCSNVFLSSNLRNKEYYIENKPVPKEEYHKRVAALTKDREALMKCYDKWRNLNAGRIVKATELLQSQDSTGDQLIGCTNCQHCFDVTGGENSAYVTDAVEPRECYDASFIYYKPELVYDSMSLLEGYNILFSVFIYYCRDVQFSEQIHNSHDILLSSCVRKGEYMILNKNYSADEYAELKQRVIEKMKQDGEYGQLPHMKYSSFAYNDTVAFEYFPLNAEQAKLQELRWNDEADKPYAGTDGIAAETLPATIGEVEDSILQQTLICTVSGKGYKITAAELAFHREMNLPLPQVHPEFRHRLRMSYRNPRQLWTRQCMCTQPDHTHKTMQCPVEFETTYSPDRKEIVYCESCYTKEIY